MDQRQIDRLRAAGGKVGLLSEVEWETLIDRHGTDTVAYATMRAKQEHGRAVAVDEVGKHLPKGVRQPVAVAVAEDEPDEPAVATSYSPVAAELAVLEAGDRFLAAAQVEAKPAEVAQFQRIPWRVFADLIRGRPGITTRELSALLGRSIDSINGMLRNHAEQLEHEQASGTAPRRWWLKGSRPADAAANPAPPQPVAAPVDESPAPVAEVVQAAPAPAPAAETEAAPPPRKRFSKPSRALERRPALTTQQQLDGELLPLLEHVIDLWCLNHEIALLKPARARLRKACAALFPEEV